MPISSLETQSIVRSQVVESACFTQDDAQARRGIEVRDHRRQRSSTRTAMLSVRFEGFGGSFRSRSRPFGLRISREGAANGMMRATGVSRSSTVTVAPFRTARRCSLRRAFKSAIRTSLMTDYGHQSYDGQRREDLAERVGFEPTVEFPLHTLSKRAPSTTRTSLRSSGIN